MDSLNDRPLRIALLSYRSKPHCGGQGVYVRNLSRELVALGHHVEVFSGHPYPELDAGPVLRRLPSLDLYLEYPFRAPPVRQWRDPIDAVEVAAMWTAAFPEPLTFSLRAARELRPRAADFDVVHDNQSLGYGLLAIRATRLPVVATIHHPISIDRRIELEQAETFRRRLILHRWYGFVRMQRRVAARLSPIVTVSRAAAADIQREFGVPAARLRVVPLGVDTDAFRPPSLPRQPGRIVAVASADTPLKGVATLLRAVAKLATERDVSLTVIGQSRPSRETRRLIEELSIADRVRFTGGLEQADMAAELGRAEVAVVASLYEGFSLPAIEAMACGTPLVATRAGALPEVVADAGRLVGPADAEELRSALLDLLDDAEQRTRLGEAGLRRVRERFTWRRAAEETVRCYREAIASRATGPC
ncbi:MAG: glycosyltransferase family 4 protein [Actinomycetota bacterium]